MARVKQLPEDFVVHEIFEKQPAKEEWKRKEEKGFYVWFDLTKRNYDMFRCLKLLARRLGVSMKRFGYAGVKDKRALTMQKVSVWNVPAERLKEIRLKDIELSNFEERNERINLGDLKANEFEITVRDIAPKEREGIEKNLEKTRKDGFINYFGEQRFGMRGDTHLVGKEILKNNLEEAVWLYLTNKGNESEEISAFRENLRKTRDIRQGLRECPKVLRNEIILMNHLVRTPNDYAGALRRLNKKFRRMLVHAYQSYLWNETAKVSQESIIPMIGFATDLSKYEAAADMEKILQKEGIAAADFRINAMPELSCEGSERERVAEAKGLKWSFADDELNEGKVKCIVGFEIPKGSYATVLIDQILC